MRQKVSDYLDKPTKKLYAQLTAMEQKFVDAKEKPKAEKPKPENK